MSVSHKTFVFCLTDKGIPRLVLDISYKILWQDLQTGIGCFKY